MMYVYYHLSYKDRCNCFIKSRTIHVYSGTNWKNKSSNSWVYLVSVKKNILVGNKSFWDINIKALNLVSNVSMLTGRVAFEDDVPKAVARTFAILDMKRNGNVRVKSAL